MQMDANHRAPAHGGTIMCFSATASFSVAAVTAVIGIVAARQAAHPREILIALTPFLFALQQTIEGLLWLELSGEGNAGHIATLSFAFQVFAKVIWPAYTPIAVFLIETSEVRRRFLIAFAAIGLFISVNLFISLLNEPSLAAINNHSIDYAVEPTRLSWQMFPYFLCTCGALFLSSRPLIRAFGGVILVGFAISAYAYVATFISVWCFFAAAASSLLYFYFRAAPENRSEFYQRAVRR